MTPDESHGYRALAVAVLASVPPAARPAFADTAIGRLWLAWVRMAPDVFAKARRAA